MAAPLKLSRNYSYHFRVFSCSNCLLNIDLVKSRNDFQRNLSLSSNKQSPKFLDFLRLEIRGGAGGQGLPKFGGFGGDGGDVTVTARSRVKSLRELAKKYPMLTCKAGTGDDSSKFHLLGNKGSNLELKVPVGVIVHLSNGNTVDLNKDKESIVVAKGGSGGTPKTNFLGLRGQSNDVGFELKLLADVGLVGFPNAGKSSFLRAVSRANPKVASYPFTTVTPQLGIAEFPDGRKISVADLPGLIEGAHQNYGKGIKFLRHAERTKTLLFVLDLNPFQLSSKYEERSAFETLLLLMQELNYYGNDMVDKPAVLAINKMDTDPTGEKLSELKDRIENLPDSLSHVDEKFHPEKLVNFEEVISISAKQKQNTEAVMQKIREVMDVRAEQRQREEMDTQMQLLKQSRNEEQLGTTYV